MRSRLGVALSSLLIASSACSLSHNPPAPFMERIYVGPVHGDTSLMYEAQIATHVFLWDNLQDAYATISADTGPDRARAFRLIATPMFGIRQLRDSSAAVRTPSFIPRITADFISVRRYGVVSTSAHSRDSTQLRARDSVAFGSHKVPVAHPAGSTLQFSSVTVTGVRLAITHHSNGQAGCFRNGFVPVDRSPFNCVPARNASGQVIDTTTVSLNRANGDFSSTFLSGGVYGTWLNRGTDNRPTHSVGGAIIYDHQLSDPVPGALSSEQRALYGGWRLHTTAELMQRFGTTCEDTTHHGADRFACAFGGRSRLSLEREFAPHLDTDLARRMNPKVLPYRYALELSHSFDYLLGAGAFVRWHRGQDYYNIGFANSRNVFLYGLMFDISGVDRVGAKIIQ